MRLVLAAASLIAVAACETATIAPSSPEAALDAYYATIPDSALPRAPEGPALPGEQTPVTRILVGSCNDEENESPVLQTIAGEEADLFLMVGDNVYGDRDGRAYANNDPDLTELRESFADLAARPEFRAARAAHPMMVAWDDHDYGANDAGGDFVFRGFAERIHEVFWGLEDEDVGAWDGTYYARRFGPEGQRVQVIMLDTRSFRSPLVPTDEWGETGKERYLPAPETRMQDMLGAAQWTWLENQLQEPADVRIIASSIQVLTSDGHGFEHWSNLPAERQRLFDLIDRTAANGVVFVSGDRHTAFLYRHGEVLDYPVHELTASSMNLSFRDETDEQDSAQIGAGYAPVNFGAVEIDWDAREIALSVHDEDGDTVRQTRFPIPARREGA
ncbi:MAG: alkaline phosphatase family protein [Alphaproteobacteria bacterium]|jgi:alkaline phosphatase D|nr:alkaline phosphatase family protein [Alphaproteobacteria bacterium]